MDRYILVTRNIFKRVFNKPTGIIMHILLPVVVSLCLLLLFAGASSAKFTVAVSDKSESVSSQNIVDIIEATGKYSIEYYGDEDLTDIITDGNASVAIEFDADFQNDILGNGSPSVHVIAPQMSEASEWIKSIIDYQVLNLVDLALAAQYEQDAYIQLVQDSKDGQVEFIPENIEDISNELEATNQMFGMYLMLAMISSCQVAFISLKDKKSGVLTRIMISPIKNRTYTVANITVNMIMQLTQIVLIVLIAQYAFGLSFHTKVYNMIIIMSVFALCSVSIGQFIASVSKNANVASAIMSLVLTPTCMIGGCFWPLEFMPKTLYNLSFIMPQRWTLDAIRYAQVGESYALCLLVILSFSVLLYLISVYIVKKQNKKYR